jgi:non-ribosomal peptide synthase protein (TIGR01720 family)
VERIDLSADAGASLDRRATELQASLDLAEGPLLRVALFHCGPRGQRLFFTVHHLAVDGVSWRVLLEDLQGAYEQALRGDAVALPPKTTSFRHWASRLDAHAQTAAMRAQLEHWTAPGRVPALPVDHPGGENSITSSREVTVSLDAAETEALLREVPAAYRTQINDALLTALAETMAAWTGERRLLVSMEGHGREDLFPGVDLSRTVGWFTTVYPVLLDLGAEGGPGESLKRVKEQLRAAPDHGIGYGMLRYLSRDDAVRRAIRAVPDPEVSFNYLGQYDQSFSDRALFDLADEPSGDLMSTAGNRKHLIDLNARIEGGRLQVEWAFSESLHSRATIERLAERYLDRLRALIAHCRSDEAGGYTPSDFPLADIDADTLALLEAELDFDELDMDYDLDPAEA